MGRPPTDSEELRIAHDRIRVLEDELAAAEAAIECICEPLVKRGAIRVGAQAMATMYEVEFLRLGRAEEKLRTLEQWLIEQMRYCYGEVRKIDDTSDPDSLVLISEGDAFAETLHFLRTGERKYIAGTEDKHRMAETAGSEPSEISWDTCESCCTDWPADRLEMHCGAMWCPDCVDEASKEPTR